MEGYIASEHVVDKVLAELINVVGISNFVAQRVVDDLAHIVASGTARRGSRNSGECLVEIVFSIRVLVVLEEGHAPSGNEIEEAGKRVEFDGKLLSQVSRLAVREHVRACHRDVRQVVHGLSKVSRRAQVLQIIGKDCNLVVECGHFAVAFCISGFCIRLESLHETLEADIEVRRTAGISRSIRSGHEKWGSEKDRPHIFFKINYNYTYPIPN